LRKNPIFIVFLVLILVSTTKAAVVGVSPSIVRYNEMLKGGYAEATITASTSFEQPLRAHFTKEGDVSEWMTFSPEGDEFVFSREKPFSFRLIMQPPLDTPSGNYTGILKITTDELASVEKGAGSSVIAQVALLIYVEVTGDEIVECRAGAITLSSAEINDPFIVKAAVKNDGNVRLRPKIQVDVYDQYQSQIVFTNTFFGSQILPTRDKGIVHEVEHNLPIGQYFAKIYLEECGISKLTTFDILERGQISDSGVLVGIRSNDIVKTKEPMAIEPIFRNQGQRKVFAKFKGEVRNLKTDKIEQVLESEELEVNSGETVTWRLFYTPKKTGTYQIAGRVLYNNKLTFEEHSKIVTAKSTGLSISWMLLIILYLIIGLVILILIGKIKKARKNRY
jgi:hypothetical protein